MPAPSPTVPTVTPSGTSDLGTVSGNGIFPIVPGPGNALVTLAATNVPAAGRRRRLLQGGNFLTVTSSAAGFVDISSSSVEDLLLTFDPPTDTNVSTGTYSFSGIASGGGGDDTLR